MNHLRRDATPQSLKAHENRHCKVPQGLKPQKEGNSQLPECVIVPATRPTAQANYLGGLIRYPGLSGPFRTTRGME